ncbi:MAG: diacylglycerol kinase family protein [Nitriliruptorales bacterium]
MHARRSFLLLVNDAAGGLEPERLAAAYAVLSGGGRVTVVMSRTPADVDRALEGLQGGTLVVAGGDGTLHLAAQRLDAAGILGEASVAVIPLGTGNDLARALGVPLDPEEAARVVLDGHPRRLDVLRDGSGLIVVNAVHLGIGAEAAEQAAGFKDELGTLAYRLGGLLAGVRESGWQLAVTLDGRALTVEHEPVLMVAIANGPTIGGGTPLCPPALPDDGLLDVVVVSATSLTARVTFAIALSNGQHLDRDDVNHARGHEVSVRGEAVRPDADGEVSEALDHHSYRIDPAAWQLLVPADVGHA